MDSRPRRAISALLLIFALGVYYHTVLQIDHSETHSFDLHPMPDGPEYFAGAVSLWREGTFRIHLAGREWPPRWLFGYSLLMLPFFPLTSQPLSVPFLVNAIFGLALILLTYSMLAAAGRWYEAGLAALLMVTLPAFIVLARSPMSEISSGFLICAGALLPLSIPHRQAQLVGFYGSFSAGRSPSGSD